ncbi:hypothetical protein BJV85_002690 [Clostridium acetobutylicum]|uniref:Uncharacterized protein n=1 Tax=Clostridium acetobutylicum (strain ATCC 824 / DSM 792 / JCM 1419 / IAM 19013 / LMG 5710 / NBRC 13948 / NRRL B-527 / VKM B-1787 / 2291 / W) TaxID=272562 RepID=Q97JH6_CLOAB|nr:MULTISPECIES: hypothetical protein [Clostridium]AAK79278.1 Hypothetical protein CA_C1307 [Clostridium acetobutylicum ATCC 824]ADZ20358.1 Conserved hypothetical protein [Clostridium acetobutylicum EA 2018]AEI31755.1 hypothetical protein SMB_G1330 [Clostridium acetobutylicum DSM 1731]AWV81474.1 hypothetical protein DK921_15505 [Clostridium acetobutylicum]MBC2393111.1 hypothetical protein [Clostridium acetobutylicum]
MDYVFSEDELIKILAKDPNVKTVEDVQNILKSCLKICFSRCSKENWTNI